MKLKLPPVVVLAVAAGTAWLLARLLPLWPLGYGWAAPAALVLGVVGVAIALAGVAAFRAAQTTVNPLTPDRTARVVQTGVFRWSRNPMYLGMLLVLAAIVLTLDSMSALVVLPAFVWSMNRFQIAPEERALERKFGAQYTEYAARVRRWL